MSEMELDAKIGRIVREFAQTKREAEELGKRLNAVSLAFSGVGAGMRVIESGGLANVSDVHKFLSSIPDETTAKSLRADVERYTDLLVLRDSQLAQLKSYGV